MRKNENWLQLSHESDNNYKRFELFLWYEGTLEQFINSNQLEISKSSITKLSSEYNWIIRRKNYLNKNRNITHKAQDKALAKITENAVKKSMEEFEKGLPLLTQQFIEVINAKQLDKVALEFMRTFPQTVEKFLDVKNKLDMDTAKIKPPNKFVIVEGFDTYAEPIVIKEDENEPD
jgi:hypothetical protein